MCMFQFPGNTDQESEVTNKVDPIVLALHIRISPLTWEGGISMRFDVIGCVAGS
jgi:hypothetical protein